MTNKETITDNTRKNKKVRRAMTSSHSSIHDTRIVLEKKRLTDLGDIIQPRIPCPANRNPSWLLSITLRVTATVGLTSGQMDDL